MIKLDNKTKRCGIYTRVSTGDQDAEMQLCELSEYAQQRGWTIHKVYTDTARGSNPNRKMLGMLMNDCRQRKLDLVAVWKLDRLFRSLKGVVSTLDELNELGIEFYSHKDQLDLTTAQGRLMMGMIACFAEFETSLIRTRVKSGLDAARARGVKLGRPNIITPMLVQEVVAQRSEGHSIRGIEKLMSGRVSRTTIERILKDSKVKKA